MKTNTAEILREYGPFPGIDKVAGVSFDGQHVWFASGDKLNALDPDSGQLARSLENGDRVFVRRNSDFRQTRNVTIVGEAVYPGPYAIQEGVDRVADVLARAGGVT